MDNKNDEKQKDQIPIWEFYGYTEDEWEQYREFQSNDDFEKNNF